jgi:hypothetical protein
MGTDMSTIVYREHGDRHRCRWPGRSHVEDATFAEIKSRVASLELAYKRPMSWLPHHLADGLVVRCGVAAGFWLGEL